MKRQRALTVYIILPSLLYGTLFVLLFTQSRSTLTTVEFRAGNVVFGAIMMLILYSKKGELTGQRDAE